VARSPWPEPRTGGARVHLDLLLPTPDPQPLVAAGAPALAQAYRLGEGCRWSVGD
jgi:hypothetical protein